MGFLAPWFLGGLLALGVPVFVHLLRRHVTVPRPVGSLMFFERGTQSSTKHRRLKYLLLFALRAALVLLVVLAFANPFVKRPATDPAGRLLMIVLDNSYSMHAGTRFEDAKREASEMLAKRPASQRAQIIALGGQVQVLTQATDDGTQLRSALESIQPGDGHASYGELARTLRSLREGSRQPADLHLFSDVQKSAMPASFADMVMPSDVALMLHQVAKGSPTENWTVASVDAPAEIADVKDPKQSRARVTVTGFHTRAAKKSVSLLVNGHIVATKQVDVPENGSATVEFAPLDVAYGFNRCEARIDGGDAFAVDDVSYFAIRRSDPEKVLFLHGIGDARSEVYYGSALAAAARASFTLQTTSAAAANDLDPSRFAFVVLSDAVSLPSIFEHNLQDYVQKGGNVLIALGTAAGHHARIPLWGSDVKDTHSYSSNAPATVGQVDFTHPSLQDAQPGRDNGGWAEAKVFYAAQVDAANAQVLARLNDGTPLLLDRPMGEGHVLLLTTGLDNLTNDLPLHPVFVAFVDRSARYLAGAERLAGSRMVDSFVALRAGNASTANVEVIDPDAKRVLSLEEARTAQTFRLERTGFYSVHFASGRDAVIGVNANRLESDLEPMPQDLQQLWAGSNSGEAQSQTVAATGDAKFQRVSLWWWVMLLALLVAIAETALSGSYMATQREDA